MRFSLVALGLLALSGCAADLCDPAALMAEVSAASAGDTIRLGACRVEGVALEVGPGVTVQGRPGSVLVGDGAEPVVRLTGATLTDVEIELDGGVGVVATGASARVEGVEIRLTRGVGVQATDLGRLDVSDLTIQGPVDPADGTSILPEADPTEGAWGLVARDVIDGDLFDVEIVRVGPWGVIVWNSRLEMRQSVVRDCVGTGIYAEGGALTLTDVRVEHPIRGLQPYPAYGLAATDGASVTSTSLTIAGGDGVGLMHDSGTGVHEGLEVSGQPHGGVWVQRGGDVTLTNASIHDNAVAGLVATGANALRVEGGTIRDTALGRSIFGAAVVEAGDGVQVFTPAGPTTLLDVSLIDNGRVGAIFDLGATPLADVSLSRVEVAGDTLGCLAQDGAGLVALGGWDDGVTRTGAVATNDPAQIDVLTVIGTVEADDLPSVDLGLLMP
ncbi:MAG: right-handed parallel beta-helix repeat-containing protein [Myxococcales bacterium]|nr:right-handed parallel beta-helix repeat-containing protein [Myxococcales bacterium]